MPLPTENHGTNHWIELTPKYAATETVFQVIDNLHKLLYFFSERNFGKTKREIKAALYIIRARFVGQHKNTYKFL